MERQISIDNVKACLSGISFPCSKTDLLNYCQQHDGSAEALETLRSVHIDDFETMEALSDELEAKTEDLDQPFDYYTVWSGYM